MLHKRNATFPVNVELLQNRLPPLLSAVAGLVDVIGYLDLRMFTAHVTGNLVIIASLLVRGGPPNMDQVLAVPVFILAVGGVWLYARQLQQHGSALASPLLLLELCLLAGVLIVAVMRHPGSDPRGLTADITAMIAVSAMACQYSLFRLAVPAAPSTAVMTGNITDAVLSFLETVSKGDPLLARAEERLKRAAYPFIAFFGGCMAGAAGFSWLGEWAWALPVALTGLTLARVTSWTGSR
jgi:uncharacterized membrane protein YoaK (UPF0700 family)